MFPVEEKIEDIRRALAANRDVVLTAPPGSGKTTCVPPALLDESWLGGKKIVMLEPRRLAARNCATYIARKRGEAVGGVVGYQVRLERKISAATRLEIVTEGLLTQRLLSDPELSDVGLVIFDEFHERSLTCDTSFALALEVRRALRPDLRILVMSATLDADEVAAHLGDADIIRAEGRMFPVETTYLGDMSMTAAISKALKETDGDILCFLPGEGEIRRVQEAVGAARGVDVLPLYGSLPKEEQDKVFAPSGLRKVILATSIAETSVTIEGISTVIDSGLMRVPRFRPASGMSGLVTLPLTQDRAEQRRGRAGRVRAGVCYRLWSEGEQQSRPKKMMPEILDADLCSLVLTSAAWGALGREDLPWMTPPPASNWDQAVWLLKMLGAIDTDGRLTKKGVAMAKLPMHPRLANMVLGSGRVASFAKASEAEDCADGVDEASLLAAIVEEGNRSRETDIRKIAEEIRETPNRPFSKRVLQLARRLKKGSDPSDTVTDTAKAAISYCSQGRNGSDPSDTVSDTAKAAISYCSQRGLTLDANKNGGDWPNPTDGAILAALPGFLGGMTKWKDLERIDLFSVFDFILAEYGHDRRELDRLAPTRMEVPSGSHMLIHYEGDEPTCEVRLQECFGLMETPKVAGGRVPVVMTLLSPAQRPIQITKDLAGFWREGYQLVRKDMRGRYPKHYWPEDPFTAVATRRTVKRGGLV